MVLMVMVVLWCLSMCKIVAVSVPTEQTIGQLDSGSSFLWVTLLDLLGPEEQ